MQPSRRSAVDPFEVVTILAKVAALRARGERVILLSVGEPSQGAPTDVRERAAAVATDGTNLGYTAGFGILPLREAIAKHYDRWYGLDVDPAQVCVTTGSSGAFLLAFLSCFDAGDRVAVARPTYPAYTNDLLALGCDVVDLGCGHDERFQPTPRLLDAAASTAPIDGLMLASPANPTGTMLDAGRLEELAGWCRAHDTWLISDEIYHGITYTGSVGCCAWQVAPEAVVISSFSKFWSMTGWRLGWMLLPPELVDTVESLTGNLFLCAPAPAQHAALGAFTDRSYAEAELAVAGFATARETVLRAAPGLGWGEIAPPDGAFYIYADIAPVLGPYPTAREWCAALLDEERVAIAPGFDFDHVDGDHTIRLSLAAGEADVREGLERIARFQARHGADGSA